MPKMKLQNGELAEQVTITKTWITIPNETNYDEYLVNPKVADYIENLENIIKGYEKILDLKKEQ